MLQDSAQVQACTLLATLASDTISIEAAVDKVQRRAAWSWRELQSVTVQLTQFDSVLNIKKSVVMFCQRM